MYARAPVGGGGGGAALADVGGKAISREGLSVVYAVFLGRPIPANLTELPSLKLTGILASIFASKEFRAEVLPRVLLREELPSDRFSGSPPHKLLNWVQQELPLDRATTVACGLVRTWLGLLEVLLADRRLASLDPDFEASGVTEILRDRIARDPQFLGEHYVVGAIDAASSFEVRGWAVDLCDRATSVHLEIYADAVFLGAARCDHLRPDVADVIGGEGRCGFVFPIASAHRSSFGGGVALSVVDSRSRSPIAPQAMVYAETIHQWDGIAEVRREIGLLRQTLERMEARLPELHRMASVPITAYPSYWERFYRPVPDVKAEQRADALALNFRPLISVVMPTFNPHSRWLDRAIRSVTEQTYAHWELLICDDASSDRTDLEIMRRRYDGDKRIRWLRANERAGIALNTNRGIAAAKGEYVAFLDHDDELAPDALFSSVVRLQGGLIALVYSDEDRIEENEYGQCVHHTPFFKPDFDPDLLLAMNYICHFVMVKVVVLRELGGLRPGVDGAQDHDLLLRLSARLAGSEIVHVPRILYHWRVTAGSVSQSQANEKGLRKTIVAIVDMHLRERGLDAMVEEHNDPVGQPRLFANRVHWRLPKLAPKVSVIVPTRDRLDLLEPCVQSVLAAAPVYPGELELLIVDNESNQNATLAYLQRLAGHRSVRILRHAGGFNWSAINNAAAREATGEVLIFLNNDTVVLTPEWCRELVTNALRPEIGAVGARLLYQDGTIQHAGVVVGVEGVAGHEAVGVPVANGGYFGRSHLARCAAAVTGACFAMRRAVFLDIGGFDELEMKVAFSDIDLCMRLRAAGYRIVYTPFATLYHFESKSRGRDLSPEDQARHRSEALAFQSRWGESAATDPFFNPHFERFARPFERLRPPPG